MLSCSNIQRFEYHCAIGTVMGPDAAFEDCIWSDDALQGDNPHEELSVRLAVMLNKMFDLLYCHRFRFCAWSGTMTNIPCRAFMSSLCRSRMIVVFLLSQKIREKERGREKESVEEKKRSRDERRRDASAEKGWENARLLFMGYLIRSLIAQR